MDTGKAECALEEREFVFLNERLRTAKELKHYTHDSTRGQLKSGESKADILK